MINGADQLQIGEPFGMPEIGLGIGRCPEIFSGSQEEVLSWFDDRGDRYLRAEEKEIQAREEADLAKQKVEKLLAKLQEMGVDADSLE